jgi:hypothetical protein
MKLRIKGNSIRLRLSKPEVEKLSTEGIVEEQTSFADHSFIYAVKKETNRTNITAEFNNNQLTVYIPENLTGDWPVNEVVSLDNRLADGTLPALYILVEKDFKCIDNSSGDQSDNYENPKTC